MPRQKGFTLLELVVVVAIIGLLASIALIPNLIRFQKKGQASKTKSDLAQMTNAMELSSSDGCTSATIQSGAAYSCGGTTYMQNVPRAQTGATYYCGTSNPTASSPGTDLSTGCTLDPSATYYIAASGFDSGASDNRAITCSKGSCWCREWSGTSIITKPDSECSTL